MGDDPLLPPTIEEDSGRHTMFYDDEAMERLWMISLLHHELGYTLKKVREILDNPDFDRMACLTEQIEKLKEKQKHLENVIKVAEAMKITGLTPQEIMSREELSAGEFVDRLADRMKSFSPKNRDKTAKAFKDPELNAAVQILRRNYNDGVDVDAASTRAQVRAMVVAFEKYHGAGGIKGLMKFGQMLSKEGEISQAFDDVLGEGTASYLGQAIVNYCSKNMA
ncbi:MAG: MerR family transcriptional regulator [Butyrivibrio hungatei]|nr:MerR family transcriptional regulator [Butyrivibrio hungatei]